MEPIRLQKYLSQKGLASRREAEKMIQNGWVKLNGEVVTEMGVKIDPGTDVIELDNRHSDWQSSRRVIAYYKPKGIVTHSAGPNEKEILDVLPQSLSDLRPIGRLDKDSEGLILLGNDGRVAKNLLDPIHPHKRKYEVHTDPPLSLGMIRKLETGITLFGEKTKRLTIKTQSEGRYEWTMTQGKNRQIRRMVQKVGSRVIGLKRVSFGTIKIGDLKPGAYRELSESELTALLT